MTFKHQIAPQPLLPFVTSHYERHPSPPPPPSPLSPFPPLPTPLLHTPTTHPPPTTTARSELTSKREEFWHTQPSYGGQREIWEALKAAAEAEDVVGLCTLNQVDP
jgi:hypothetical protein